MRPLRCGAVQSIHSLIRMIANTCMIDLYPASAVSSFLIDKLEKLSSRASAIFSLGKLRTEPPNAPRIWNSKLCYPSCLWNSSPRNPSPSELQDATHGMGIDILWNNPVVLVKSTVKMTANSFNSDFLWKATKRNGSLWDSFCQRKCSLFPIQGSFKIS